MFVIYQNHNPINASTRSTSHFATNEDVSGGGIQRRIGDAYHDDPLADGLATDSQPYNGGDNQGVRSGPAIQPSRLHGDENEWREV